MKMVSIVLPFLNEEACIKPLYNELVEKTKDLPYRFEFIFIDDCSSDRSLAILKALKAQDSRVRYIRLSRIFGHQMSIICGIENSLGDAIIMMDTDLQHPPAVIGALIRKWEEGFLVVNTIRDLSAGAGWAQALTSRFFYKAFSLLTGLKISENVADFRLIDRKIAGHIAALPESNFFIRGMISWLGFRQGSVHYAAPPRFGGSAKYNFIKRINFGIDGMTSFTVFPLRLATLLGLAIIAADIAYLTYSLFVYFALGIAEKGWTSVIFVISVYSAIQILLIGVLGEYLARIHLEAKKRPRYIVEEFG